MNFNQVLNHLAELSQNRGIRYDLGPVQSALTELNLIDIGIPTVQVAGTNGKGSTVWGIAATLQSMGYTVGVYTSPHIECYTERIAINGVPIAHADFVSAYTAIARVATRFRLTEFEALTLMAMYYFNQKRPDYLILETGLGGRLDATTAVKIDLAVITRIGKDHMAILGNTLGTIAREKAGIIRASVPVVVGPQVSRVRSVFQHRSTALNAKLYWAFALPKSSHIFPAYKRENWGIVQTVLQVLKGKVGILAFQKLIQNPPQFWGRFTQIQTKNGTVIIDGAHNPNGLRQLAKALNEQFPTHPIRLIMGILATKDAKKMIQIASTITTDIHYCDFDPGQSVPLSEIKSYSSAQIHPFSLEFDLKNEYTAHSNAKSQPITVFTGSLYFIAKLHSIKWT